MHIHYKNKLRCYLYPTLLMSWNMSLPRIFVANIIKTIKMGAPADHHSNFASEQSLRRSYSTIHGSPFNANLPRLSPVSNHDSDESDGSGIDVEVHHSSLLNIDRRGRVI